MRVGSGPIDRRCPVLSGLAAVAAAARADLGGRSIGRHFTDRGPPVSICWLGAAAATAGRGEGRGEPIDGRSGAPITGFREAADGSVGLLTPGQSDQS